MDRVGLLEIYDVHDAPRIATATAENRRQQEKLPSARESAKQGDVAKGTAVKVSVLQEYRKHGTLVEKYDVVSRRADVTRELHFGYLSNVAGFHHPIYSHARAHGPDLDLRKLLEPLFLAHGVSIVFAGHDHVYERLKPQNGIYYFVLGNSGQLRFHDLKPSPETAQGFDTDRTFALVEIAENQVYFQVVSRTGETVDSGLLELRQ